MSCYEKMDQREKKESAILFLDLMREEVQHNEALADVILLRFAPHVNHKIA